MLFWFEDILRWSEEVDKSKRKTGVFHLQLYQTGYLNFIQSISIFGSINKMKPTKLGYKKYTKEIEENLKVMIVHPECGRTMYVSKDFCYHDQLSKKHGSKCALCAKKENEIMSSQIICNGKAIKFMDWNVQEIPYAIENILTHGSKVWREKKIWLVRRRDDRGAVKLPEGVLFGRWIGHGDGAILTLDESGDCFNECGEIVSRGR